MKNTVAKGNDFERQVYEVIKRLVENDEFVSSSRNCKVYWKKGYYSKSRQKEIVFDISIESYIKNAPKYSFLTIIECKNYEGSVPVDDIEEFDSKLNQIGEHNTKGIIITKSSFQVSASNLAISKGLGIAIIDSENEIDWISYRKIKLSENLVSDESIKVNNKDFFAFFDNQTFSTLPELLISLGLIEKYSFKPNCIYIPYRTPEQINDEIKEFPKEIYKSGSLDFIILCKYLKSKFQVDFEFEENLNYAEKDKVLGKITFNPLKIFVSNEISSDIYRWRFTLAHEIGHLVLHSKLLSKYFEQIVDVEKTLNLSGQLSDKTNQYMEIQANIFASLLLLPLEDLLDEVNKYFFENNIHKGYLYFDNQPVNRSLVFNLLRKIKDRFEVSNEVAKYRLQSLGLIQGENLMSMKDILQGT